MTKHDDDFFIGLDTPCSVWDALKYIAQEKLIERCHFMIEAGATRQELTAHLNDVLLPQAHEWMRAQHAFIVEVMKDDAVQSTSKH